jgi:hypothetical protein
VGGAEEKESIFGVHVLLVCRMYILNLNHSSNIQRLLFFYGFFLPPLLFYYIKEY